MTATLFPAVDNVPVLGLIPCHFTLNDVPASGRVASVEQFEPAGSAPLNFTDPEVTGYLVLPATLWSWHVCPAAVPNRPLPFTLLALGFFGGTSERMGLRPSEPLRPQSTMADVPAGATFRLRFRTRFGETPFDAVTVIGNEPATLGVPRKIPPLLSEMPPPTEGGLIVNVGVGEPVTPVKV